VRLLVRSAPYLLVAYSLFLAVALFSPTNDQQSAAVVWLADVLKAVGIPDRLVTFNRLEVVMNAVIVAPVTFLGSLVFPRFSWRDWTAYAFAAAVTVELVQGLLLPGREGSFSDIVANTAGACAGAVLIRAIPPRLRTGKSV